MMKGIFFATMDELQRVPACAQSAALVFLKPVRSSLEISASFLYHKEAVDDEQSRECQFAKKQTEPPS